MCCRPLDRTNNIFPPCKLSRVADDHVLRHLNIVQCSPYAQTDRSFLPRNGKYHQQIHVAFRSPCIACMGAKKYDLFRREL